MQQLMQVKRLSKQELKSIMGGTVTCCRPGGNYNPPKGGNKECGEEPTYCNTPEWEIWQYCVGKDYPFPYSCSILAELI